MNIRCFIAATAALSSLVLVLPANIARADKFQHFSRSEHSADCNNCHFLSAKDNWAQNDRIAIKGPTGDLHFVCYRCHQSDFQNHVVARCATCHLGRQAKETVTYPPYRPRGRSDFSLARFDHLAHAEKIGIGCERCHTDKVSPSTDHQAPKHAACATAACHGGQTAPKMTECAGCHVGRKNIPVAELASAESDPWRVNTAFAHPEHAKRSKESACKNCHVSLGSAPGERITLPPMAACERCHDGTRAFFALGTGCAKCHGKIEVPRADGERMRYRHEQHAAQGIQLNCNVCHVSTAAGRLSFPGQDHKPCANSSCHAAEFQKRDTRFCSSCHRGTTMVWEPASADEFEGNYSHQIHFERKKSALLGLESCATCHPDQVGRARPARQPLGVLAPAHEACGSCHEALSKPPMTECTACHASKKEKAAATDGSWRVDDRFRHETHRADVRTKGELACTECHGDVMKDAVEKTRTRPTMEGCGACHNGEYAFDVTGFQCIKCHASGGGR